MAIVNLYIDGFNLYYGALKRPPYKWLDSANLPKHYSHPTPFGNYTTLRRGAVHGPTTQQQLTIKVSTSAP